jgi:DNA-binding IclR family transcriptional regulator
MIVGTVSKALGLLDILKEPGARPGLTEIARLAGFDKATTRRLLLELIANGFVEQDEINKHYVLGPALQMLGRAREERFPLYKTILPIVRNLAEETGETAHATEYGAGVLISVCTQESDKTNRVSLVAGQKLPLHATASGLAFLAASSASFIESFMKKPRKQFTSNTPVEADQLLKTIGQTKARGFSISNQSMEDGIESVAAAYLDAAGKPIGTIAVAMPSTRANADKIETYGRAAAVAAGEISSKLFGRPTQLRKAS